MANVVHGHAPAAKNANETIIPGDLVSVNMQTAQVTRLTDRITIVPPPGMRLLGTGYRDENGYMIVRLAPDTTDDPLRTEFMLSDLVPR